MLRTVRVLGVVVVAFAAGCSLEHPIADFEPDAGNAASDTGVPDDLPLAVDSPPETDVVSTMDAVIASDTTEPDVLTADAESDAGNEESPVDASTTDAGVDAGVDAPPPTDTGVDVSTPMDTGVDVPPVDTGVDVPPVDTGVDVPVVDSGHDAGSSPMSCGIGSGCPTWYYCTDPVFGGDCVGCGRSGESCCWFTAHPCQGSLSCDLGGNCH